MTTTKDWLWNVQKTALKSEAISFWMARDAQCAVHKFTHRTGSACNSGMPEAVRSFQRANKFAAVAEQTRELVAGLASQEARLFEFDILYIVELMAFSLWLCKPRLTNCYYYHYYYNSKAATHNILQLACSVAPSAELLRLPPICVVWCSSELLARFNRFSCVIEQNCRPNSLVYRTQLIYMNVLLAPICLLGLE